MAGIGSSIVTPPRYRPNIERPRSENKRSKIIDVAMRHFAEQGYHAARVGDMATELGIAKGSIFQHFGSKDGLFFEVYKKAVRSFSRYLDAPTEVRERARSPTESYGSVGDDGGDPEDIAGHVVADEQASVRGKSGDARPAVGVGHVVPARRKIRDCAGRRRIDRR